MNWLEGFRKTRERFAGALRGVLGSARPDEATLEELADLLIMADVPLRLVDEISHELRQTASARETPRDALRRGRHEDGGPVDGDHVAVPAGLSEPRRDERSPRPPVGAGRV